ncbi:hypothetical protein T08_9636 [Trichinella sp. T8]|nr:hypothetical protein T08_9636 [Trichinella sp. T8]
MKAPKKCQYIEQTGLTTRWYWPPTRACGYEKRKKAATLQFLNPTNKKSPPHPHFPPWTGPCREMKKIPSRFPLTSTSVRRTLSQMIVAIIVAFSNDLSFEFIFGGPLLIKSLFADFLPSFKRVAAMVHLLSLFFPFIGLSIVAQAAKDCDGTLRFDVLNTVDDREIFSHRLTDSLEDCVKTCYSKSDFCFSVLFMPSKTGKHQCLLSYHAAYMCSKRKLISEYPPVQEPTLVECIRCVGGSAETKGKEAKKVTIMSTPRPTVTESEEKSGEMIGQSEKSDENPENNNNNNTVVDEIVESSAESETKSEETIEQFTTEIVLEGSAEGTTEDLIGSSGMKIDEDERANSTTDDHTLKEIMESEIAFVTEELEYEAVQKISKKPDDHDFTNSDEDVDEIFADNSTATIPSPNKESLRKKEDRDFVDSIERAMAFEHDASPETVQTAVSNGSDESGDAGHNEQKEVEIIDNEDDDNDNEEEPNNEQSSSLIIHDKKPNFDLKSNFDQQTAVSNQPKALCTDGLSFQTKLASSHSGIVYSQESPANSTQDCVEICHARRCSSGVFLKPVLSGEAGSCLMAFGGETCDEDLERITRYDGPSPVEIHCIRCDLAKEDKQITTVPDVKTKLQSKAQQSCAGRITFEVVEPNRHRKGDFVTHELARSVADCARICFERGCTVAGFSQASVETDPSFCLLSFKTDTCSGLGRVDQLKSAEHSVQIQCIRCETASTSAEKSDKQRETAAKESNTVPVTTESAKIVTECEGGNCTPASSSSTSSEKTTSGELFKKERSRVPEKEKCSNDLSFQVFQPGERQTVNFTSDRRSESAAHCARLCYESETCELAAYIAAPKGLSSGVCLLSEDAGYCESNAEHVVQHSSVSPFLITCITCSKCTFNVKNYVPVKQDDAAWDTFFDDFEMQVDAKNVHECAEKCASRRCTLAVYSGQTKHGNCLMTIKANRSCGTEKSHEIVDTSGKLPVLIDCVQCAAA